jgi:hypothetical protein
VGPRLGLDAVAKKRFIASAGNRTSILQPIFTHPELSRFHNLQCISSFLNTVYTFLFDTLFSGTC